jgi:recombination protein RecA
MLCGKALKTNTTLIFINQTRDKVGSTGYGPQKTTSGGHALKFYASVRVEVARIGSLTQNDEKYGNRVKFKVVKNKVAPPFKEVEVDIIFGEGVSTWGEIIDYGIDRKVIKKSGAWISYEEGMLGQGKDNAIQKLKSSPELADKIKSQVYASLGVKRDAEGK